MSDYKEEIMLLQSQVNDLRWRMQEVCNFLVNNFGNLMSIYTLNYMVEDVPEKPKQTLAGLHEHD